MVEPTLVVVIITGIFTLANSVLAWVSHMRRSSCCGGSVEFDPETKPDEKPRSRD